MPPRWKNGERIVWAGGGERLACDCCGGSPYACEPGTFPAAVYVTLAGLRVCPSSGRFSTGPFYSPPDLCDEGVTVWEQREAGRQGGDGTHRLDFVSLVGGVATYAYTGNAGGATGLLARLECERGQASGFGCGAEPVPSLTTSPVNLGCSVSIACLEKPDGSGEHEFVVVGVGTTGPPEDFPGAVFDLGFDLTGSDGLDEVAAALYNGQNGLPAGAFLAFPGVTYRAHNRYRWGPTTCPTGPDDDGCGNITWVGCGRADGVYDDGPGCYFGGGAGYIIEDGHRSYGGAGTFGIPAGPFVVEYTLDTECNRIGIANWTPSVLSQAVAVESIRFTLSEETLDDLAPGKGACCLPDTAGISGEEDGGCVYTDAEVCADLAGEFHEGQLCAEADCTDVVPTGACCLPGGSCFDLTSAQCAASGGDYRGDGTACATTECDPPLGACCDVDGGCTQTTQAGCTGQGTSWQEGVSCAAAGCQPVLGACCVGSDCEPNVTRAHCRDVLGGVFYAGIGCGKLVCDGVDPGDPGEGGACCFGPGLCFLSSSQAVCEGNGGTFVGGTCFPNPCGDNGPAVQAHPTSPAPPTAPFSPLDPELGVDAVI